MSRELKMLVDLMALKKLESERKMMAIQSKKSAIHDDLSSVEQLRRESNSICSELDVMRSMGADLHWRAWLARSREQLNIELMQLETQLDPLKRQHRLHAGRHIAASELAVSDRFGKKK